SPIHIYRPERMGSAGLRDVDALLFRHIDEVGPISGGNHSLSAGGLASRIRFKLVVSTIGEEHPCPGLERNLTDFGLWKRPGPGRKISIGIAVALDVRAIGNSQPVVDSVPQPFCSRNRSQDHPTIWCPRGWPIGQWRASLTTAPLTASSLSVV